MRRREREKKGGKREKAKAWLQPVHFLSHSSVKVSQLYLPRIIDDRETLLDIDWQPLQRVLTFQLTNISSERKRKKDERRKVLTEERRKIEKKGRSVQCSDCCKIVVVENLHLGERVETSHWKQEERFHDLSLFSNTFLSGKEWLWKVYCNLSKSSLS